jgi:hypothetical protein
MMNDLVSRVNQQIVRVTSPSWESFMLSAPQSNAVSRAGSSVTFVDYDHYVGKYGGRFCEAGIDESRDESNSR